MDISSKQSSSIAIQSQLTIGFGFKPSVEDAQQIIEPN